MKRGYTSLEYKSTVRKLRRERPDLSLTSDFIVGFPGETDADFAQTMDLVEAVDFDGSFSFAYSPRPGTPAAAFADPVPPEVQNARLVAAAGAPRRAVPRVQRGDGRHAAARSRHRRRRPRARTSSPAGRRTIASSISPATRRSSARTPTSRSRPRGRIRCAANSRTRANAPAAAGRNASRISRPTRRFHGEVMMKSLTQPQLPPAHARILVALTALTLALGGCAVTPETSHAPDKAPSSPPTTDAAKVAAAVAAGVAAGSAAGARPGASPAQRRAGSGRRRGRRGRPQAVRRRDQGRDRDCRASSARGRRTRRSGSSSRPTSSARRSCSRPT